MALRIGCACMCLATLATRRVSDCVRCALPYAGVPSGDTRRWQALVDLARGSELPEAVCQAGQVVSSSVVPQSHHEHTVTW